jgi:organic hydroperoxide reductase OsmC/OhrA
MSGKRIAWHFKESIPTGPNPEEMINAGFSGCYSRALPASQRKTSKITAWV